MRGIEIQVTIPGRERRLLLPTIEPGQHRRGATPPSVVGDKRRRRSGRARWPSTRCSNAIGADGGVMKRLSATTLPIRQALQLLATNSARPATSSLEISGTVVGAGTCAWKTKVGGVLDDTTGAAGFSFCCGRRHGALDSRALERASGKGQRQKPTPLAWLCFMPGEEHEWQPLAVQYSAPAAAAGAWRGVPVFFIGSPWAFK